MAQKKSRATFWIDTVVSVQREFMSEGVNNNCATVAAAMSGDIPAPTGTIRHLYVHIPFCARICPYCAFYKDLLDRSQTSRFCEAILSDLDLLRTRFAIL